ncbi:MAG TPA: hypothetical protein VN223_09980 [Candidatus Elarobacter sp.]|nr:hypothetical protein [Candidatus Elarobacter sp.]
MAALRSFFLSRAAILPLFFTGLGFAFGSFRMQVGYGVIGGNDFHGVDDVYSALFGLRRKQLIATTSSKGRGVCGV